MKLVKYFEPQILTKPLFAICGNKCNWWWVWIL